MFDKIGQYAETGVKAVKNMSALQKGGLIAGGLILGGIVLLMMSSSEDEVIPATNVEVSDSAAVADEPIEVEVAVADEK